MIYQPRNVQPSGVSIDGLLDNTFTMEIQTNSYVSAYQLLIVDFDNNEIYTGSKTTLTNYAYNGDTLEIPVNASTVALSNGTNYKWRVRLYQPTADMLITYGLVQATSTTTTIYLQPNINIKAGMAITINSQTKTISSYNSDTGVAVVSSAFSSAPAVGTQYKIYSDFIETVPDYIVYARRTPAVAISNVPSSLTLKYHTFQGTYTQSDNVAIVYHQFDLYTRNDDGTISLVASSDKVYSANLSYTYDSFRTGNKYLIQMTVENDMGIISTTDMYEFTVSYDIVEYLQQPLASFDDKNNAVKVSWVTPVENEATSFRSDAATGIIQDNNNTLTQATFEPGQSIGEGDVVQITNSDCELVVDGRSTQKTRSGNNILEFNNRTAVVSGLDITFKDGIVTLSGTPTNHGVVDLGTYTLKAGSYYQCANGSDNFTNYSVIRSVANGSVILGVDGSFTLTEETQVQFQIYFNNKFTGTYTYRPMVNEGSDLLDWEQGGASPSPDYPSEIESVGYTNLFDKDNANILNAYLSSEKIVSSTSARVIYIPCHPNTTYKVQKVIGNAFSVAYAEDTPDIGVSIIGRINTKSSPTLTITTGANAKYLVSQIMDSGDTLTEEEILKSIQIEKGSIAHSYIPYGKSGIEVKTVGKNLLNLTNGTYSHNGIIAVVKNGTITLNGTATNTAFATILLSNDYSINDGEQITISTNNPISNSNVRIRIDANGYIDTTLDKVNKVATYTKTSKETIIGNKIQIRVQDGITLENYVIKPQLEKGTVATEYEEYKSNTTVLALNEPLRSLPNGVKDIAYIKNNKLYVDRYVGSVVLDGTESIWTKVNEGFYTPTHSWGNKSKAATLSNYFQTFTKYNGGFQQATNGAGFLYENVYHYYLKIDGITTVEELKTWLSNNNVQVDYELATPVTEELGSSAIPYIDGVNYMHISSNMDTMFSLVYPHKTITGNTYDYTEFNPPGVKQTGTIKSYNAITGVGILMAQYPFTYIPMQGDPYAVVSNIYNISGFSYLYNTPYNTVNSLYTHGYTATWATPDGLCVLPDDFNITLQFSPDGNFYYTDDGTYQEVVNLITTETDDINNRGEFTIKIDKNKLIFTQQTEDGGSIVWDGNTEGKISVQGMLYKLSDITPSKEDLIGNKLTLTSPDEVKTFNIVAEDDGVSSDICCPVDLDDSGNYAIATLLPVVVVITTPTSTYPSTGIYFLYYDGMYVSELGLGNIVLEAPFYTHTNQVFVLSSASITQINNDYVWDDTATWTDTYTWVEGGTSLERVCNHWWKVQITNTGIKIEEIFPTT